VSAPVFWAEPAGLVVGSTLVLDGAEGHHAASVRRLREGERLLLTDGAGTGAGCVVVDAGRDRLTVVVEELALAPAPSPRLVVVQALPKGDRGETAVETLTEVGVDAIVPWLADRSVTRWEGERGTRSLARWRSTAREASKQSRRLWWPDVAPLATTAEVATLLRASAVGAVLDEAAEQPLARLDIPASGDVVIVIGPEGGLTAAELDLFAAAAGAYRLGDSVLRTSTAGTVAAGVILARTPRWGRWPCGYRPKYARHGPKPLTTTSSAPRASQLDRRRRRCSRRSTPSPRRISSTPFGS
jgi:16S rRNA (uracil1498-N3)-methyltransferase